MERFDSIVSLPRIEVFGSFRQWVPMSDWYVLPHDDAWTAFIVDCSPTTNGRVASVVNDDHGRIAIDIVFNNIQEYKVAYDKWKMERNSAEKSDEILDLDEFSGFIRISRNLDLYYG
jgi:hypothetical protein